MYDIEFTSDAERDLDWLRKFEQKEIVLEIRNQLGFQPAVETRNRKRLRPNDLAEWELRIREFRAFYDVDEPGRTVRIQAIGRKVGSRLFLHGEEYYL